MATSSFLKVRISGPDRRLVERAAVTIAKSFKLGRVDGSVIHGQQGDWLAWVDVVVEDES